MCLLKEEEEDLKLPPPKNNVGSKYNEDYAWTTSPIPPVPAKNRSVKDYDSEESLRNALLERPLPCPTDDNKESAAAAATATAKVSDWELVNYKKDCTEVQTMEEELRRLLVLKSYLILDAERDLVFDRLTRLARMHFQVDICHIGLIDLGRQWFLSEQGLSDMLGGAREIFRPLTFCNHTIWHKQNLMVVPDATKDPRFCDNPAVTGGPCIRFYAGVALTSPEGYRLGSFCLNHSKPRPEGLSPDEEAFLRDITALAVRELVLRREKITLPYFPPSLSCNPLDNQDDDGKDPATEKRQQQPAPLSLSYVMHDLMTSLTGIQMSLHLLNGEESIQALLGKERAEMLDKAAQLSDFMVQLCQATRETLHQQQRDSGSSSTYAAPRTDVTSSTTLLHQDDNDCSKDQQHHHHKSVSSLNSSVTCMTRLLDNIKLLTQHLVPPPIAGQPQALTLSMDDNVPSAVVCDELILLRCAVNLISNCLERSRHHKTAAPAAVHLCISRQGHEDQSDRLLFECTDQGCCFDQEENVPAEMRHELYFREPWWVPADLSGKSSRPAQPRLLGVGLCSIAGALEPIHGNYGYRCRPHHNRSDQEPAPLRGDETSTFWFSIPLMTPRDFGVRGKEEQLMPLKVIRRLEFANISLNQLRPLSSPGKHDDDNDDDGDHHHHVAKASMSSLPAPSTLLARAKNSSNSISLMLDAAETGPKKVQRHGKGGSGGKLCTDSFVHHHHSSSLDSLDASGSSSAALDADAAKRSASVSSLMELGRESVSSNKRFKVDDAMARPAN